MPGHQQPHKQVFVYIAEFDVGDTRNSGCENLRDMNAGAGGSRRRACCQQERGGGNAVSHAQGAIHHLREKPDHHRAPENTPAECFADNLPAAQPVIGKKKATGQKNHERNQNHNANHTRLEETDGLQDERQAPRRVEAPVADVPR